MSEKKEFTITPAAGVSELIILEGKAEETFEKAPKVITISGVVDSPLKWLEKRINLIDQKKSNILVDRDKMSMLLVVNEKEHYNETIKGSLELHPKFKKFSINEGKYITTLEMGDLIKMNRSYFESPSVAMQLVSALKNFEANVTKNLLNSDNSRGNKKAVVDQIVTSNIPEKFNMKIPVFKGLQNELFEVEVYIEANQLTCTLISPDANDLIERVRDEAIDNVIEEIKKIAVDIVIIEQ